DLDRAGQALVRRAAKVHGVGCVACVRRACASSAWSLARAISIGTGIVGLGSAQAVVNVVGCGIQWEDLTKAEYSKSPAVVRSAASACVESAEGEISILNILEERT